MQWLKCMAKQKQPHVDLYPETRWISEMTYNYVGKWWGLIRDDGWVYYTLDIQAVFPPEVNGVWSVYFWGPNTEPQQVTLDV